MKKYVSILMCQSALGLSAFAAVPLRWTVETSRATPAQFEAYQGETLALEASLQSYGKPLEASGIAALYWQTNGMGSAYWETSAAVNSNRLSAVFTPEMDVGAKVYNCFIGVPGTIYHAAFQLRLRPSPGALPNVLPLPVPVIDFAKVRVLNPPWESGGGGGVNTNAVIDIIHATVDGVARPLPKYLHLYEAHDSYPDAAAEYYRSRGNGKVDGGCSSVRDGGFLYRNFDYPFDDRAEFVVKMSAGKDRFASVGVAQVGTNLTEEIVTSGKPNRCYKWLPGATVDGINENGVACNINVVDGDPQTSGWHNDTGDLHPLAAVRWILDNATNAQHAAEYIAAHIAFPSGWTQNFHYMIADERETWIVENGKAAICAEYNPIMSNFLCVIPSEGGIFDPSFGIGGSGSERYLYLDENYGSLLSITNVWYTRAYSADTSWRTEFFDDTLMATSKVLWAQKPKEAHRGETFEGYSWWQTVHTSIYDLTNRVLRVSVQETDDWYTFQVPSSGAKIDAYKKAETDGLLAGKATLWPADYSNFENGSVNVTTVRASSTVEGAQIVGGSVSDEEGNNLANKANRADSSGEVLENELATLDEDGNPTRSGKTVDDFIQKNDDTGFEMSELSAGWDAEQGGFSFYSDGDRAFTIFPFAKLIKGWYGGWSWITDENDNNLQDALDAKADRSMISVTDPTFSNEVAKVAKTVTPTPTGTLRLFDPVLNRWVILKSVNMNLTLEVE